MFLNRPPWFALVCVGLWALQLGFSAVAFQWLGPVPAPMQHWWELAEVTISLGLGALLLLQLPRALKWRPRLSRRPSAAVVAERRRIAADLHDTVGSQLICAMVLLDQTAAREREIHALLEKCMLDLRLIVDSLHGTDAPFLDRLAQLRYRIEPILAQHGITMQWEVQPCDGEYVPTGERASHLLAIVQEALSNALQYAQATEIKVACGYQEAVGSWYVEVGDNGKGIERWQSAHAGRGEGTGLAGMANRARLAGGKLHVLKGQRGGTCIRAEVPSAPEATAP